MRSPVKAKFFHKHLLLDSRWGMSKLILFGVGVILPSTVWEAQHYSQQTLTQGVSLNGQCNAWVDPVVLVATRSIAVVLGPTGLYFVMCRTY